MSMKFKAAIIAVLSWCIVMPILWLNNISVSSGIEINVLMAGFKPQMAMIVLCLAGIILLFLKGAWIGYYLVACAVIPFACLLIFGAVSTDEVILNTVLLAIMACVVLFGSRAVVRCD